MENYLKSSSGKKALPAMNVGFNRLAQSHLKVKDAWGRNLKVKDAFGRRGPIKKLSDQLNSDHPDVSYSNFPSALSASRDVTLTAENPEYLVPKKDPYRMHEDVSDLFL